VELCRGLARLSGFSVRTGFPVRTLEPRGERILVAGEEGAVLAARVVVAVNAYLSSLLPGLAAGLEAVRGQMLATEPGERTLTGVWHLDSGHEYARQLDDGTFILGGRRRAAPDVEVGFLASPTATVQGALDDFLRQAFPALADRRVAWRWAGTLAVTPRRLPAVGEIPGLPGALYVAGFSGRGLSLGFAVGRHLARRAAGEELPPLFPEAVERDRPR
jgi:glycine/D-amino acid oxidase-like deaminating enzyme